MKKSIITIALFSASLTISQQVCAQNTGQTAADNGLYTLTAGDLCMTVDAEHGARITSLTYKGQEVISQSKWPETFGSTFWTSPQKEWNWPPVPEYDKQPYTVSNGCCENETQCKDKKEKCCKEKLTLTSSVSPRLGFRIQKSFCTEEDAFVIDYTIINTTDSARSVAPWEITRVPNAGLIFFDAPAEAITPAGLLTFTASHGAVWYHADTTNENRKINADGNGWLAYASNGLLLIKQFDNLKAGEPAPEEAEIQVYVNRGKTYIELESQGAYKRLAPGASLTYSVRWLLMPCSESAEPSDDLVDKVKKALR